MTTLRKLKHYTVGDKAFYSHVLTIVLPLIIQNTITNVVSLLDNVMVGATGTLPMSAVAIVNQLLFIFNLAIWGGYAGAGIFSAQYAGRGDNEGVRYCFRGKLYIGMLSLALAFTIFLGFADNLISSYIVEGTAAEDAATTMRLGKEYLNVMLIGLPAFALAQAYAGTLREMGQTKVPMIASVVAIFVNLIFNYIFIFGNQGLKILPFGPMGVKGAALATVISRYVEMAIIMVYVHKSYKKYPFIQGVYRSPRIPKELTGNIIKRGAPLLANEIMWSVGMAAIMQCYSRRGLDVVAATNISNTINNLFNVVFLSMGNAIAIILGHLLGSNQMEKARVDVWRLLTVSVGGCVVLGGVLALVAPYVPHIYNTTDEVKAMATNLLFVVAGMMPFYAFAHGCYFALRSGGKTWITFCFDTGFTWLSYGTAFTLAYFTSMPIIPLYFCVQLLETSKCVVGFIVIKKGVWVNNIVDK